MVSIKQKLSSSPNNQRITEITNYNDFRTSEMISVLSISNWLTGIWLSCPLIIPLFHHSIMFYRLPRQAFTQTPQILWLKWRVLAKVLSCS